MSLGTFFKERAAVLAAATVGATASSEASAAAGNSAAIAAAAGEVATFGDGAPEQMEEPQQKRLKQEHELATDWLISISQSGQDLAIWPGARQMQHSPLSGQADASWPTSWETPQIFGWPGYQSTKG